MKGILRYKVIKEKKIEFDDDTFDSNKSIKAFWDDLLQEENGVEIQGVWIKDMNGKKIYN